MKSRPPALRKQKGAAAVEFALVSILFFILLLGVVEMGRVLFTWNAAAEATRYGARVAAVCDMNDTAIVSRMQRIMPNLLNENIAVQYLPSGCTKDDTTGGTPCLWVKVSIKDFQIQTHIPVVGALLTVPSFATTLPRESLDSAGGSNPVCT